MPTSGVRTQVRSWAMAFGAQGREIEPDGIGRAAISFAVPVVDDGFMASKVLGIILAAIVAWGSTYWVPNEDQD